MFSVSHLNKLRQAELSAVLPWFPESGRVLEIGAGTGRQAAIIASRGYEVEAIDLPNSDYSNAGGPDHAADAVEDVAAGTW